MDIVIHTKKSWWDNEEKLFGLVMYAKQLPILHYVNANYSLYATDVVDVQIGTSKSKNMKNKNKNNFI